jgi:hypothetical protein
MGLKSFLRTTILRTDLLYVEPTLRVRRHNYYETVWGGVISIAILTVFYYFLYIQMSSMLQKLEITYTQSTVDDITSTSTISSFPFAVSIDGVNLGATPFKFIIELWQ